MAKSNHRDRIWLAQQIDAGLTAKEISKLVGVKEATVVKYIYDFDLPIKHHEMMKIGEPLWTGYILTQPAVKKNSQTFAGGGSRTIMVKTPKFKIYEMEAERYFKQQAAPTPGPINVPVNIVFRFYVDAMRRMDISNLYEAPQDMMTKAGIIADDCDDFVVGHDMSRIHFDKKNPRTEIYIYEYNHFITKDIYEWIKYEKTLVYPRRTKRYIKTRSVDKAVSD